MLIFLRILGKSLRNFSEMLKSIFGFEGQALLVNNIQIQPGLKAKLPLINLLFKSSIEHLRERLSDFRDKKFENSPRVRQILHRVNSLICTPKKQQSSSITIKSITALDHSRLGLEIQILPKRNNRASCPPTPPLFYKVNWTAPKFNLMLHRSPLEDTIVLGGSQLYTL